MRAPPGARATRRKPSQRRPGPPFGAEDEPSGKEDLRVTHHDAESPPSNAAKPFRGRLLVCFGVLGTLLFLTACGDGDPADLGGSGDKPGGPAVPGKPSLPPRAPGSGGPAPGAAAAPMPGANKTGAWANTEFRPFGHATLPLKQLKPADCLKYTAALAKYGNHPSGGMDRSNPSIKKEGDECLGWRTREPESIRDLKAGDVEYSLGYGCSPVYKNLDQLDDRLGQDQKEVRDAGPNAVASPFYRLPDIMQGYAFSLQRNGTASSTTARAVFHAEAGLCTVSLRIQVWAPADNGKGLKYVAVDEAKAFDELNRMLTAMINS